MRSLLSLLTLSLFFSVSAFAEPQAVVTAISPASGPAGGGTRVTITGSHLNAQVQCIIPCPTQVTFGGVTVSALEEYEDHLLVIAPPHDPDTVDVTVAPAGAERAVVADGYTYFSSGEDNAERVLLPIYTDGIIEGAHGTRWKTDFWFRNNSASKTVTVAPWPCNAICPPVYPLTNPIPPHTAFHDLPPHYVAEPATPSRILYLSRNEPEISMSLRVADISRAGLNTGTEIPVVREPELLSGALDLLNVPYDPSKFRLMLRIYDLYAEAAQYRVTLYAQGEDGSAPPEHEVILTAQSPQTGDFRTEAAYVQYDFAPLGEVDKVWPSAFRIHIQPLDANSRYWAFVSLTNDETQLITLVTPQ